MTLSLSLFAQGVVRIEVLGNKNKQIIVDGKSYTTTGSSSSLRDPIYITGLANGQHQIEVDNNLNNTTKNNITMGSFRLRSGYDMNITIRNNGTIQLKEAKSVSTSAHPGQYHTPMSASNFNKLIQNIRGSRATARPGLVTNAIETGNNYFTTSQGRQLVSQVSNQTSRQNLLESLFLRITDPENFSDLYDLLNTQARRDAIARVINDYNYNYSIASVSSHNAYVNPMNSSSFNTFYQNAQRQSSSNLRMNYILNVLADPNNYFTSDQARQLIQMVSEESNRLLLAKTAWRGITDATNFTEVSELLYSSASRNELNNYINAYSTLPAPTVHSPMSGTEFSTLYDKVSKQWLPGGKMDVLKNTFDNSAMYFTTAQAKQLIQLVSSESNRMELAKSSYSRIVDQENFSQLYDIFSKQSTRDELAAFVRAQGGTSTTIPTGRIAMDTDDYDLLYRDVRGAWGLGARMNQLTNIFGNSNNNFSSLQVKQLIELVSAESNRLQLAKTAYGRTVDPENYTVVYDVLSSQASKNELSEYIKPGY